MIKVKIISKERSKNGMPSDRMQWEEHGHPWDIPAREAASESNHITKQLSCSSYKHQGHKRSGETEVSKVKENRRTGQLMATHQLSWNLLLNSTFQQKDFYWNSDEVRHERGVHTCLFLYFHSRIGKMWGRSSVENMQ